MKKILYTLLLITSLFACNKKDVIKGTAVSFYPDLVDAVAEGGSSSATLELTGPGQGTVTLKVSDPEFITTTPAMVDGTIEIVFAGEDSKTFDIDVARGGRTEDYIVNFDVVSVSGDIKDIASGTFKLYVSAIPSLALPFSDDFESCSTEYATPAQWNEVFEDGSKTDRGWGCRAGDGVDGGTCVRASAYGGEDGTDYAWLITKGSLDLSTVAEAYMTFDIKSNYSGDGELFVKWSEDYSGSGDPTSATWEEVPGVASQLPEQGSGTYKKVAAELTSLAGKKVFIGFQYTGATSGNAASYEMDNFLVTEDGSGFENFLLPFSDNLDNCSNFSIPVNFNQVRSDGSKQDRGWECSSNGVSGSQAVTASGLGGVDGTVDAWLISAKSFDLSSITTGTLSFDIKSREAGLGELKVLWSENYSGSGSTDAATWATLTDFTAPTTNVFETAELDISGAAGKTVYIAFQFAGATNTSSVSYDVDNINVSAASGGGGSGGDIYGQDFNGCSSGFPSDWTVYSVASSAEFGCSADTRGASGTAGDYGAEMNNYLSDVAGDDWLISPALDLGTSGADLSFNSLLRYDGSVVKVMVSSDYTGSGDPNSATWTELTAATNALDGDTSSWDYVASGNIDLSSFSGTIYIAFHYTSTGTQSGEASTFRVDDFAVNSK